MSYHYGPFFGSLGVKINADKNYLKNAAAKWYKLKFF
jgi:hypothetical protein